jgi:hypothetical protein
VYDDAQVIVLEEALLISMNNKSRWIEKDFKNPKHRSYISRDLARLVQTLFKIYVFVELENTLSQNVCRSIMK